MVEPLAPIDPRRLLILRLVAQAGSLAGAARRLGWTQPAVSQQVHRLEQEVGAPLLARTARGATLTDVGTLLLRHADAIASRLAAVSEEASAHGAREAVRVRLAAFPSASKGLVLPALSALAARRPDVTASLIVAEPDEAMAMLRRGAADVAVVFAYVPEREEPRMERRPLMTEPLLLVLPRSHPLASDPYLGLADLRGERWISGCDRCRGHLLTVCHAAGFTPEIRHRLDDFVLVQHLVADGHGIAMLPGLAFATFRHPDIAVRAVPGLGRRQIDCMIAADGREVPAVAAAVDGLAEAASRATHAAPWRRARSRAGGVGAHR